MVAKNNAVIVTGAASGIGLAMTMGLGCDREAAAVDGHPSIATVLLPMRDKTALAKPPRKPC